MGRICEHLGLGAASLMESFHQLARLMAAYLQEPVTHVDETGWRTNGHNEYIWLFATPQLSPSLFCQTCSASVPREVFGKSLLLGCLVVDHYGAYHKPSSVIHYCYNHLLREVHDLEEECPNAVAVTTFVKTVARRLPWRWSCGLNSSPRPSFKQWIIRSSPRQMSSADTKSAGRLRESKRK
jgi:transposase